MDWELAFAQFKNNLIVGIPAIIISCLFLWLRQIRRSKKGGKDE